MSLSNEELVEVGALIGDLDTEIKRLTEKKKKLETKFRPAIASMGSIQCGAYLISLTVSEGRKTLDKEALESDGIDLEKYQKQGAPFTTMKITRTGD